MSSVLFSLASRTSAPLRAIPRCSRLTLALLAGAAIVAASPTDAVAAVPGELRFNKTFGAFGSEVQPSATAIDLEGSILWTGYLTGAVDFGGGTLTSAGGSDIVIAKLSSSGNHIWSKRFGDAADHQAGGAIKTAFSGDDEDLFLAKLDRHGNHLWSKSFGDGGMQLSGGVAVDLEGNIGITGGIGGVVDFGGGPLVGGFIFPLAFAAKLDYRLRSPANEIALGELRQREQRVADLAVRGQIRRAVAGALARYLAEHALAREVLGGEVLLHALFVHEARGLPGDLGPQAPEAFGTHDSTRSARTPRRRWMAPPTSLPPRGAP